MYQFALGVFAFVAHSDLAVCRDRHRYFENMSTRSHISSLSTETVQPFGLLRPPFQSTNYILVQSTDSEFFRVIGNQRALASSLKNSPNRNSAAPVVAALIPD